LVIVDLAIEDDEDSVVFVKNGLLTPGKIYDCQPSHAERDAVICPDALLIWPPVTNDFAHGINEMFGALAGTLLVNETGYSTHFCVTFSLWMFNALL
jgi:hypothetical protein